MSRKRGRWSWKNLVAEAKRAGLKRRGGRWYRRKNDGRWERVCYDPSLGWVSDSDIALASGGPEKVLGAL